LEPAAVTMTPWPDAEGAKAAGPGSVLLRCGATPPRGTVPTKALGRRNGRDMPSGAHWKIES